MSTLPFRHHLLPPQLGFDSISKLRGSFANSETGIGIGMRSPTGRTNRIFWSALRRGPAFQLGWAQAMWTGRTLGMHGGHAWKHGGDIGGCTSPTTWSTKNDGCQESKDIHPTFSSFAVDTPFSTVDVSTLLSPVSLRDRL